MSIRETQFIEACEAIVKAGLSGDIIAYRDGTKPAVLFRPALPRCMEIPGLSALRTFTFDTAEGTVGIPPERVGEWARIVWSEIMTVIKERGA